MVYRPPGTGTLTNLGAGLHGDPILDALPPPRFHVYTCDRWPLSATEWILHPYLRVGSVAYRSAPEIGTAILIWEFGRVTQYGQAVATYPPLVVADAPDGVGIIGKFIKIEVIPNIEPDPLDNETAPMPPWYGVITEPDAFSAGKVADNPTGRQRFYCQDLKYLLAKTTVNTAWVRQDAAPHEIDEPPVFNLRHPGGRSQQGNRTTAYHLAPGLEDVAENYCGFFSEDGELWNHADIAHYLLVLFGPRYSNDPEDPESQRPMFHIGDYVEMDAWEILGHWTDSFRANGQDLLTLLNQLIPRQRCLSWHLQTMGYGDVSIVIDSHAAEPFVGGGGDIILPANANILDLDLDAHPEWFPRIRQSEDKRFAAVTIRAQPLVCMCTASMIDMMGSGWTAAHRTIYVDGCKIVAHYDEFGSGDYAETTKAKENDKARKREELRRVYRLFRLLPEWDGKAWESIMYGVARQWVVPRCLADGTLEIDYAAGDKPILWRPAIRFERELPLEIGVKYEPIFNTGHFVRDDLPAGAEPEYMAPFMLVKLLDEAAAYRQRYVRSDQCEDPYPRASLRMMGRESALEVNFPAAHMFKGSALPEPTEYEDWEHYFDYLDALWTLAIQAHVRPHITEPVSDGLTPTAVGTLVIDTDAEYHYCARGTILDIDPANRNEYAIPIDEGLVLFKGIFHATYPEWRKYMLRCDLELLQATAALARGWYSTARLELTLEIPVAGSEYIPLGTMIRAMEGSHHTGPINSVVTEVVWEVDAESRRPSEGTTRIGTTAGTISRTGWRQIARRADGGLP